MRYAGVPWGMWVLFEGSFRRNLTDVFGYDEAQAKGTTLAARRRYRQIVGDLPEFERTDRFRVNIVSCAMLCAFVLSMGERPSLAEVTEYYRASMMTASMRRFCRLSARSKFSGRDVRAMRHAAELRAADRNPYSWNVELRPYEDGSGYEMRFTSCGICMLMRELGLSDLVGALCRLDYAMSEAGGASTFVRTHTLGSGGPYCDCGYVKKDACLVSGRGEDV